MKFLTPLFCIVLPVGCLAQSGMRAIGERNSAGVPVGDYRVVNAAGTTEAQGRFQDGKMEGKWIFFDSHQVKLAEVVFQSGVPSGPYQTFFGSRYNPAAAGKLESKGKFEKGQMVGQHVAYGPDGEVFSDATFEAGSVRRVATGANEAAARTAAVDVQFVQTIGNVVRSAVH